MLDRLPRQFFILMGAIFLGGVTSCRESPQPPTAPLPSLQRPLIQLTKSSQTRAPILIPRAAFLERGGLPGVFVLQAGQARFRMVKAGKTYGERLQILSGLSGEEILILGDLQAVQDGSPIHTQ